MYQNTVMSNTLTKTGQHVLSIVMVSFIWGNLIFKEPVKSEIMAYLAVWLIMAGLYGMSYYSTSDWADDNEMTNSNHLHRNDSGDEADDDDNEQEILLDGGNIHHTVDTITTYMANK